MYKQDNISGQMRQKMCLCNCNDGYKTHRYVNAAFRNKLATSRFKWHIACIIVYKNGKAFYSRVTKAEFGHTL